MHPHAAMLVSLGARAKTDDLVDLLAACHGQIRKHVVFARRLAAEGSGWRLDIVRDTAGWIRRYFTIALPLHIADEDDTLAPRLVGMGGEIAQAMKTMAVDHIDHQLRIDRLIQLARLLETNPAQLPAVAPPLGRLVEDIAAELSVHLELEERVVFPAIRMLPAATQETVLAEVRRRREATSPQP